MWTVTDTDGKTTIEGASRRSVSLGSQGKAANGSEMLNKEKKKKSQQGKKRRLSEIEEDQGDVEHYGDEDDGSFGDEEPNGDDVEIVEEGALPFDSWGWKTVNADNEFLGMEGFLGLEELDGTDYELKEGRITKVGASVKTPKKKKQKMEETPKKVQENVQEKVQENVQGKGSEKDSKRLTKAEKKQQRKAEQEKLEEGLEESQAEEVKEEGEEVKEAVAKKTENEKKADRIEERRNERKMKREKHNMGKNKPEITLESPAAATDAAPIDMSKWDAYGLHPKLLQGLQHLRFAEPTEIQKKCLNVAMTEKRDVVGSAETGSGKTLAFGLPILNYLARREEHFPTLDMKKAKSRLRALILAPTRELAIQVQDHLVAAARFTNIEITALVGGVSTNKQLRLLSYSPEIIVATPGRFWELMTSDAPYLRDFSQLKFLVLDEADRMIEEGHFKELDDILDAVKRGNYGKAESDAAFLVDMGAEEEEARRLASEAERKQKKQIFLFSATLALEENFKKQVKGRKTHHTGTLAVLIEKVGFPEPGPAIVDVTRKGVMAEKVQESRIFCPLEEKDSYVYYFLNRFAGRTIVFVNSVDAIRRLVNVLTLLQVPCGGLHAQMQQRQRLKNLDRFKELTNFVLVATDVAARGLDIPDVQHVIHYQIPRSPDLYVHRAGRTARAKKEGLSILLIAADEVEPYKKICKVLGKAEGITEFPVEMTFFPAIRKRTKLAAKIDKDDHVIKKKNHNIDWFVKNAQEMDVELDDETLKGVSKDDPREFAARQRIHDMKEELKRLLSQTILPMGNSARYITSGLIQNLPEKYRESERKGKNMVPQNTQMTAIQTSKTKSKH